jgi:hypothetical protein
MGTLCMMLIGCPGCLKKSSAPRPSPLNKNPDVTQGLDDLTCQFTGGYTFIIPLSNDRVLSAKADSGEVTRENGLQVFHLKLVTCDVHERGVVTLQMSGDTAKAIRLDKLTLDTTLTGHVVATETTQHQQANADHLHWLSNETLIHLWNFVLAGKNSAGEPYSLRAPMGAVNTTFTEVHWTGRGTVEMTGTTRKK